MNIKSSLRYIWLAVGVFSLILLTFHWFGYAPQNLQNAILALNVAGFVFAAPCSLFFVPVAWAANRYLELSPFAGDGIYLNTILLFVLGFVQWFWIARIWSPTESMFQNLDLIEGKTD